ncbi:MAG: TIGR04255 family protein [Chloroflexaceae bacterium]|nr:TIGR04255 family protein [Chloroflexaceae bacterium]
MGRKYAHSPIIEVVCEVHFGADSEWDMTVPGLVYERVKDTLPKRQQVRAFVLKLPPDSRPEFTATDRIQFCAENGQSFIQVSPRVLAVNHLKPYPLWETYSSLIQKGFNAYCDVTRPTTIERIGLRYINKIEFEEKTVELEDFFNFYPFLGTGLPQDYAHFNVEILALFANGRDILKTKLTSISSEPSTEDKSSILLDLDYFLGKPGTIPPDGVLAWVNEAHQQVEEAFEACIKDSLRAKFSEEEAEQ